MNRLFLKFVFLFAILAFAVNSCIIVKEKDEYVDVAPSVSLSPRPEIQMSETIIRSEKGDMISNIPEGWFFVDVEDRVSPDVIAVAVNPDYTLSCLFTVIKQNEKITQTAQKEGLMGLARAGFSRHDVKTAGAVKLSGKYRQIDMGSKQFVEYEYSTTAGGLPAKSAVFISTIGEYYEFSLIPMSVSGKELPSPDEMNRVFRSILASIQY